MSPIKLNGSTSGFVALDAPAVAGSNTLVLPTGNGSSGQYLQTNGSGALSWATVAGSKLLQVVQTVVASQFSTTSTSFVDVTGLSASITPASTSNKILVYYSVFSNSSNGGSFSLVRGSTAIGGGSATSPVFYAYGDGINGITSSYMFLDSPSTTSSTTYKVQMKVGAGTGYTYGGPTSSYNIPSQITLMEVAP